HQPAGIDHDADRLTPFDLVHARHQPSAPRARRPADIAKLVTFTVLPQALECPASTADRFRAPFQIELPAANKVQGRALGLTDVRVADDALIDRDARPALCEADRTLITHVGATDVDNAALPWPDLVVALRNAMRAHHHVNHRNIRTQRVRHRVDDARAQR